MSRISLGHYWRLLFHIGTGGHHRFLVGRQILLQCLQPDTPVDPPRAVGLVSSPCMHLCQTSLSYGLFQSYPLSHNPLYLLRSSLLFYALPKSNSVFQYSTVTNYYLFVVFKVPRLAVLRPIYLKRGRIPVLLHNRLFKLYLIHVDSIVFIAHACCCKCYNIMVIIIFAMNELSVTSIIIILITTSIVCIVR